MVAREEQPQRIEIAEELTPRQLLAVHMEVAGTYTYQEIAAKIGIVALTLANWRKLPAYIAKKQELLDKIEAARLERLTTDANEILDAACVDAAKELKALTKTADADSVRVNAIKAVFDYSKNGPKAGKRAGDGDEGGARGTTINLSMTIVRNAMAALRDIDDRETLKLAERVGGADDSDESDADVAAHSKQGADESDASD